MRALTAFLFVLAAVGCGYRTYLTPAPAQVHRGEPLPIRAAVAATDAAPSKDASRALLGYDGATVRDFTADYLEKTRLFERVDSVLPADAEIFVTVLAMQTVADETPLLSRENSVECSVRLQHRAFFRFMPGVTVAGEASGFGRSVSPVALTAGNYQQAMSQALDRAVSQIYADLAAALVPRAAEIRAWVAAGKAETIAPPSASASDETWEEVKPIEEKP